MTAPCIPRRALIVIDVQHEYVSGNLRIEHPPVHSSLQQIGRAIDAAHATGVPVVVVQNDAPPVASLFAQGSEGHALHAVVATRRHDHLVHKTLPSAFAETDLAEWLVERDIDTLAVAGYMTHNCDASTIIDAVHRGFAVEFLVDASGAVPYRNDAGFASAEDIHRVFSVVLHARFAAVVSTARWIDALHDRAALARGSIAASNRAAMTHA